MTEVEFIKKKNPDVDFTELKKGDYFLFTGVVFLKQDAGCATNLNSATTEAFTDGCLVQRIAYIKFIYGM